MNEKIRISVLGCGWLGLPLAMELNNIGYKIKGSTTSHEKLTELKRCQIDPFLVQLNPELDFNPVGEFFETDILIITIPPKKQPENYLEQIRQVLSQIRKSGIKKVIYISSTSVYANSGREFNEDDEPNPETESGKAILKAEEMLLGDPDFKTAVIRMGGLTGPGRDPARFLAGKTNVPNARGPINLIHLNDCIGIIKSVIEKDAFGSVLNAVCPDHPTREEFYTLAAEVSDLPPPEFIEELKDWKIVNSVRIPELLDYQFQVQGWMAWLRSHQVL